MISVMEERSRLNSWLYTSRRTARAETEGAVEDVVAVSRLRNADLEVTGALIRTGGFFAQCIEGPLDSIAALKASILRDPRHTDILTVDMAPLPKRRFADWSLAYSGDTIEFDQLIAVARVMRGPAGQQLLFEMIRRFADEPHD